MVLLRGARCRRKLRFRLQTALHQKVRPVDRSAPTHGSLQQVVVLIDVDEQSVHPAVQANGSRGQVFANQALQVLKMPGKTEPGLTSPMVFASLHEEMW